MNIQVKFSLMSYRTSLNDEVGHFRTGATPLFVRAVQDLCFLQSFNVNIVLLAVLQEQSR